MYLPEDRHTFETILLDMKYKFKQVQKENARLIKENNELKAQLQELKNVRHSNMGGAEKQK